MGPHLCPAQLLPTQNALCPATPIISAALAGTRALIRKLLQPSPARLPTLGFQLRTDPWGCEGLPLGTQEARPVVHLGSEVQV